MTTKIRNEQIDLSTLPLGRKNTIINGGMEFWQRGTTFNLSMDPTTQLQYYTADRFIAFPGYHPTSNTPNSATVSRQDVNDPNIPQRRYALRYTQNIAYDTSKESPFISQRIEDYRTFAGFVVTASWHMKASSSAVVLKDAGLLQSSDGTTAAGTAVNTELDTINTPLNTTWTKYSATFTLPATNALTPVTLDSSFLQWFVHVDVPVGEYYEITEIQVERGSVATQFEYRSYQEELAMCQRYFEKSYDTDVAPGSASLAGAVHGADFSVQNTYHCYAAFKVSKRVRPTVIIYNPNNGAANYLYQVHGTSSGQHAVNTVNAGTSGITHIYTVNSITQDSRNLFEFHWTADAEL